MWPNTRHKEQKFWLKFYLFYSFLAKIFGPFSWASLCWATYGPQKISFHLLLEIGNQLLEEAKRKREIIKMLEKNEETIKDNEKNEKKIIEEKIKTEKERGIKRIKESLELSQLANKLESYGVIVDYDIKEFVIGEKSS